MSVDSEWYIPRHFFSSIGKYPPLIHLRSTYRINFSHEQKSYVVIFSLNFIFSYSIILHWFWMETKVKGVIYTLRKDS